MPDYTFISSFKRIVVSTDPDEPTPKADPDEPTPKTDPDEPTPEEIRDHMKSENAAGQNYNLIIPKSPPPVDNSTFLVESASWNL